MINAILVDDEVSAIGVIETLISEFSDEIRICARCTSVESAVQAITKHQPELIFLDVELRDGSGFEVFEPFDQLPGRVVFVTAFEHYALKAIKNHAFDYLLKPIDPIEFQTMLTQVVAEIRSGSPFMEKISMTRIKEALNNKIAIPTRNGFHYIDVSSILYIQGDGSYARVFLSDNKEVMVSKLLKDFETILYSHGFLRVHKSYLVNISRIKELRKDEGGYLILDNGQNIPISYKERENVLNRLKMLSRHV